MAVQPAPDSDSADETDDDTWLDELLEIAEDWCRGEFVDYPDDTTVKSSLYTSADTLAFNVLVHTEDVPEPLVDNPTLLAKILRETTETCGLQERLEAELEDTTMNTTTDTDADDDAPDLDRLANYALDFDNLHTHVREAVEDCSDDELIQLINQQDWSDTVYGSPIEAMRAWGAEETDDQIRAGLEDAVAYLVRVRIAHRINPDVDERHH